MCKVVFGNENKLDELDKIDYISLNALVFLLKKQQDAIVAIIGAKDITAMQFFEVLYACKIAKCTTPPTTGVLPIGVLTTRQ